MIHCKRQVAALEALGIDSRVFWLGSRTSPWVLITEWRRLRDEIRSSQPDLIHAQFGTMTAFLAAFSTTRPLVVTYRGSDLNPWRTRKLRGMFARLLSQVAALRAKSIICVSTETKSRLWWRQSRVTVMPTGVDTQVFYPRPKETCRAELGWSEGERVVLFNAGLDPVSKRLDLARRAIEVAKRSTRNIRLVTLDGNVAPEIVPTMMNAADCLLLTSDWEGSPTVVQEAIATNLPVVTVDAGDVRERLAGIEPSRIVGRHAYEIGKALADILRLGQRSNGCTRVGNLTGEAISRQVVAVYQAALRAPGGS